MNQRASLPAAKGRRAWLYLSMLLPALGGEVVQAPQSPAYPPRNPKGHSQPYLTVIGPPPLRFQELVPLPDIPTHPSPAGTSPSAAGSSTLSKPAGSSAETPSPAALLAAAHPAQPTTAGAEGKASDVPTPSGPPILPDDVRPAVRPEDLLPYFEFPGSLRPPPSAPVPPAPPAPGTLPPSSATYQQQ